MKPLHIAFIGLGAMGYPMAGHLSRHYTTTVWNRTLAKAYTHADEFGSTALEKLSMVCNADVIISCLPTSGEVAQLTSKLIDTLRAGQIWIDCTSGDPEASRNLAAELGEVGVTFVDAPISGGTIGAEQGKLTVMVGSSLETFAHIQPILACFGQNIVRVGEIGSGHATKAVNNLLLAVNLWAAGEGLLGLAGAGVDLEAALSVINTSSGRSNASENLIPQRVLNRSFPATFKLGLLHKDIGLALKVLQASGISSPIANLSESLFRAARDTIGSDTDHTAALQLLEQWAKRKIT